MARSAPAPKVGPKFTELKVALLSSTRLIFCFKDIENRNDYDFMSEWSVLAVDFQGMGVKPPITLLNSVLTKVKVFGIPSQTLWKSLTEKLLSLAR